MGCLIFAPPPPSKQECDNFITVVEKIDGYVMVCGTNAGRPKCWMLVRVLFLFSVKEAAAAGRMGQHAGWGLLQRLGVTFPAEA